MWAQDFINWNLLDWFLINCLINLDYVFHWASEEWFKELLKLIRFSKHSHLEQISLLTWWYQHLDHHILIGWHFFNHNITYSRLFGPIQTLDIFFISLLDFQSFRFQHKYPYNFPIIHISNIYSEVTTIPEIYMQYNTDVSMSSNSSLWSKASSWYWITVGSITRYWTYVTSNEYNPIWKKDIVYRTCVF